MKNEEMMIIIYAKAVLNNAYVNVPNIPPDIHISLLNEKKK
jgi:hypothetical protein